MIEPTESSISHDDSSIHEVIDAEIVDDEDDNQGPADALAARQSFVKDVATCVHCLMAVLPVISQTLRQVYDEAGSKGNVALIPSQVPTTDLTTSQGFASTATESISSLGQNSKQQICTSESILADPPIPTKGSPSEVQRLTELQKYLPYSSVEHDHHLPGRHAELELMLPLISRKFNSKIKDSNFSSQTQYPIHISMSMPRVPKDPKPFSHRVPYTVQRPTTMETRSPPPYYRNPNSTHERASAVWSPEDDQLLWDARENRKLGWPQIAELFQDKSPNVCRKRYERLKLQKAPDEWEGAKFDALAEVYVQCREDMWRNIAEQLGERDKWQTLEHQVWFRSHFHLLSTFAQSYRVYLAIKNMLFVKTFLKKKSHETGAIRYPSFSITIHMDPKTVTNTASTISACPKASRNCSKRPTEAVIDIVPALPAPLTKVPSVPTLAKVAAACDSIHRSLSVIVTAAHVVP